MACAFIPGMRDNPPGCDAGGCCHRSTVTRNTGTARVDPVDFYDLKGDMEALFPLTGNARCIHLRRGRTRGIASRAVARRSDTDKARLAGLGRLHPLLASQLDLDRGYLSCLNLSMQPLKRVGWRNFSRFPAFPRLGVIWLCVVDDTLSVADLQAAVQRGSRRFAAGAADFRCLPGKRYRNRAKKHRLWLDSTGLFTHTYRTRYRGVVTHVTDRLGKEFGATLRD